MHNNCTFNFKWRRQSFMQLLSFFFLTQTASVVRFWQGVIDRIYCGFCHVHTISDHISASTEPREENAMPHRMCHREFRTMATPLPKSSGAAWPDTIPTRTALRSSEWHRMVPFCIYRTTIVWRYKFITQGVDRCMKIIYDRPSGTRIKAPHQHLRGGGFFIKFY